MQFVNLHQTMPSHEFDGPGLKQLVAQGILKQSRAAHFHIHKKQNVAWQVCVIQREEPADKPRYKT